MSQPLRILVVEDNAADLEMLERELRRSNLSFTLHHVHKEADFLKGLEDFNPEIVLADYTLPAFTGMEALTLFRQRNVDAPFICVSGTIGEESAVELMRQGATDFVPKGRIQKLVPAIQRALREVAQRQEQRRAETLLRNSESRFRALFEGAGTGIAVEDLQGKIVETNRALQQMLGYTAEELQQITRRDFTHAGEQKEDEEHFKRLLAGEANHYQIEERFVRKDGRMIWGRLTVSMVRDAAGQPQFPLAMIEDITERQRAEEAHQRHASIVESSNDAIISKTFDGVIFSWNPAAERVYGYSAREANGRSISMLIPPDKEAELADTLERIKCGERIATFETTRLRKDGVLIHVSVTTSPLKDGSGKIIGTSSISRDITERKLAEEALRKSEAGLARAQKIARLGNWELDLKTGALAWSDETYRIFGMTRAHFGGNSAAFYKQVHPDDVELLQGAKEETLKTGKMYSVDHRIILPNGEIKTVAEQAELIRDEGGNPARLLGTVLDITERKRAEDRSAAFAKLGQRLSSATTAVEAARIIVEVADNLFGWDSCCIDLCSPDRSVVTSIVCMDFVNGWRIDVPLPFLNAAPNAHTRRILEQGAELILRQPPYQSSPDFTLFGDKSRPSASLMFVPVRNGAKVIGTMTIQSYSAHAYSRNDLDTLQALGDHCGGALERIRAEAENQKLAAFAQLNPNPVMELSAAGQVTYSNEAARQMARSFDKSELSEMLPPETAVIIKECLATGRSKMRHQSVLNQRTLSWSFFPIQISGVVHCYAGDITERRNLEAQLRQAQKMESVGQLAGGIAHDFNNILTVIQGHTSLLGMQLNLPEAALESAQQIGLAAERAANLTRQLLTFSRRQIIQPKNLDLNEVVNIMTKMLRRLLGEDVTLQVNYAPGLPLIHADPGMMEQVLLNLSVNARDAMPKGGRLFIHTSVVAVAEAEARQIAGAVPGDYVCLTVKDTGHGIKPENLPRIFEPFFTTKDVGKGTGLGLATVYGIAQQHRGWIKVASAVGKETEFKVFLPAIAAKPEVRGVKVPEPKVRGGTETILVVEDETPVRVLVRSVLERHGYRVLEAESGVDALPIWLEHRDNISMLLTDMVMPHGVSGRELAERLRGDKPELKVIYTSGYSLAVVGTDMVLKEGLNFLQKPYHPRKLAQTIRDCFDGGEC
ncbi:MAG: multi-sensor hybrid histidine kinase [Pedosphaera sp.]|nr:multi-sensor hybrid histidine kinase [Pedosphaera sp.]